jgi:cobalt/nickel transport system permease protein
MDIDRYSHLTSPVHAWDARFKVFSLLLLVFIFASVGKPINLLIIAIAAVALIMLTRIPLLFVLKVLKAPSLLLLVMVPILIITWGGDVLFSIGFIHLYSDGLRASIRIAVKSFSIVLVFIALFGTSPLHVTMKAIQFFRMPASLVAIFLFTYRYIFLFVEDVRKLLMAGKLRGHTLQRGMKNMKTSVNVMITLLIRSFEQSERVYASMHLRGFEGGFHSLTDFRCSWRDFAKGFVHLGIGLLIVSLEIT